MTGPTQDLREKIQKLYELRQEKEHLESMLKDVNKEKEHLEKQVIPELMDDLEITKLKIEGIGTMYLQSDLYYNVLAADREKAYNWLREEGHGDIISETVPYQTMRSFLKERMEEGDTIPDVFNVKPIQVAKLRRS